MTSLLKPKNIRRIIVALALLAPIGYLFGSQIAALAGAHGEQIIREDEEILLRTDYLEVQGLTNSNISSSRGLSVSFDDNLFTVSGTYDFNGTTIFVLSSSFSSYREFGYQLSYVAGGLNTKMSVTKDGVSVVSDGFIHGVSTNNINAFYMYFGSGDYGREFNYQFYFKVFSIDEPNFDYSTIDDVYFSKYSVTLDSFEYSQPVYGVPSYPESLFSNMFTSNNFLTEWGANALSDDRRGFAPVGELFSYVDQNMLHLSDSQIGLMGYGYMYYVVHVLLLDLVGMAFVFIVSIPERILDQINGKGGGDW